MDVTSARGVLRQKGGVSLELSEVRGNRAEHGLTPDVMAGRTINARIAGHPEAGTVIGMSGRLFMQQPQDELSANCRSGRGRDYHPAISLRNTEIIW